MLKRTSKQLSIFSSLEEILLAAAAYNFKRAMRVLLDLIKRISIEPVNTSFMLKYCF